MKSSSKITSRPLSPEQQFKALIAKSAPKQQALIRSVRKTLRTRFPSANELAYDYPNAFVFSYSPTERGSDSVVAISAEANGMRLIFNQGPTLPNPKKILLGSGKATRFVWVDSPKTLNLPEIKSLLKAATDAMKIPLGPGGSGNLIIKESSSKRRPKRKTAQ